MATDDLENVIPLFRKSPADQVAEEMIVQWEAYFQHAGLSLTDPQTAVAVKTAVSMMELLVGGMHATGGLDEEQRDSLRWWLGTGRIAAEDMQR